MKIVYNPLKKLSKTNSNAGAGKSAFDEMLNRHLSQVKSGNLDYDKQALKEIKAELEEAGYFSDKGLDTLKNEDPEYFSKGVAKKTLAETFSKKNSAQLKSRIKKYEHLIEMKAKKYGVDPNLLAALIRQESNFNPYALSHCGAMGLGQLMPGTARYLGVKDPFNAAQNLDGAAKYLKEQLDNFGGSIEKALAAYNAGPGAVKKYGGIPPYKETQNYVKAIKSHYNQVAALDLFPSKKV